MGSVQAEIQVLAVINANTTGKDDALNHLVEGLDSAVGKVLNVTAVRVLGKQTGMAFHGTFLYEETRWHKSYCALDPASGGLGSSPGWSHCVVFLGKVFYSRSVSLHKK